jgi:hypothetical protein
MNTSKKQPATFTIARLLVGGGYFGEVSFAYEEAIGLCELLGWN